MGQPEHPPEYLQRYSQEHLFYEVDMFFRLGFFRSSTEFQASSDLAIVLNNASLECIVLHLRNLLDFFYTQPRKTDVCATMFYESGKVPSDFPAESDTLREAHRRAHKEMSHLTTERLWGGDPRKAWNVSQLTREIRNVIERFLQTASPTRLHPDFVQLTKQLLNLVRS